MKSVIIIPARMKSKRLPGKPLLEVGEKSLLEWTYWRAKASWPNGTIVATSDQAIIDHCNSKKLPWMDTVDHPTGTHRVAEAAAKLTSQYDVVVNWQVDEPLVKSADIEKLIKRLDFADISTLVAPISYKDWQNWDVVKVAVSDRISHDVCRWFSRAPMAGALGHVGVYAFRWDVLQRISRLDSTPLSEAESLEQLAWLENAWTIQAVKTKRIPLSVNTPEDLERFKEIVDAQVD